MVKSRFRRSFPVMHLTTKQAAEILGISRETLLRWFREGRIAEVDRDRNGWRIYTEDDIRELKAFVESRRRPGPRREQRRLFDDR